MSECIHMQVKCVCGDVIEDCGCVGVPSVGRPVLLPSIHRRLCERCENKKLEKPKPPSPAAIGMRAAFKQLQRRSS